MYRIFPLNMGSFEIEGSVLNFLSDIGKTITIPSVSWLIDGAPEPILVDVGFESASIATKRHKMKATRSPEEKLESALRRRGLSPGDIKTVVLTHLHWDHVGNAHILKDARFLVQEEELKAAYVPLPQLAMAYDRWTFEDLKFELVQGERELYDGIRLVPTAGHTPGHQSVVVKTEVGSIAIAGDAVNTYRCLKEDILPVSVSLENAWRSVQKLKRTADVILPGHDMAVLERTSYP